MTTVVEGRKMTTSSKQATRMIIFRVRWRATSPRPAKVWAWRPRKGRGHIGLLINNVLRINYASSGPASWPLSARRPVWPSLHSLAPPPPPLPSPRWSPQTGTSRRAMNFEPSQRSLCVHMNDFAWLPAWMAARPPLYLQNQSLTSGDWRQCTATSGASQTRAPLPRSVAQLEARRRIQEAAGQNYSSWWRWPVRTHKGPASQPAKLLQCFQSAVSLCWPCSSSLCLSSRQLA